MNDILLHIIIITYNRSEQLRRTLNSVLEIPPVINFKVLILDNASSDSTPEVTAEFAAANPDKIECVRHRFNIGLSGNLLRAMESSRGEYTWILADDDILDPPALKNVFLALADNVADVVLLSKMGWSQNNKPGIASLSQHLSEGLRFYHATRWTTNVIFRTSLITDKTIHAGYHLTASLFPQLPIFTNAVSKNVNVFLCETEAVSRRMETGPSWPFHVVVNGWFDAVAKTVPENMRIKAMAEIFDKPENLLARLRNNVLKEACLGLFEFQGYLKTFKYLRISGKIYFGFFLAIASIVQLLSLLTQKNSKSLKYLQNRPFAN